MFKYYFLNTLTGDKREINIEDCYKLVFDLNNNLWNQQSKMFIQRNLNYYYAFVMIVFPDKDYCIFAHFTEEDFEDYYIFTQDIFHVLWQNNVTYFDDYKWLSTNKS